MSSLVSKIVLVVQYSISTRMESTCQSVKTRMCLSVMKDPSSFLCSSLLTLYIIFNLKETSYVKLVLATLCFLASVEDKNRLKQLPSTTNVPINVFNFLDPAIAPLHEAQPLDRWLSASIVAPATTLASMAYIETYTV